MNNSIAVPDDRAWPLQQYVPPTEAVPGQRVYSAVNILDFPTFLRILQHWSWLILGAVAFGVLAAIIITLLTTPVYRASVTLEANPPTVSVSDEQSREREATIGNSYDFVRTQAGLLSSKTVAQRTAQELNLANNPQFVPQDADASTRLRTATDRIHGGLKVIPPEEGQLIKFTYDSTSPAAGGDRSPTGSPTVSSIRRCSGDMKRPPMPATSSSGRSPRRAATSNGRNGRWSPMRRREGIINTSVGQDGRQSDAGSLQGESLISLNKALADATARRVAAEGAYRSVTGPTTEVTQSTQALRQQRATLQADYQQKRTFMKPDHPEMQSLQAQIDELERQIGRESAQMASGRNNSLLAEYRGALSAERALQVRVNQLKGSVLNLRGRSIQYNILQREVDTNRSLYDALLQRFKEIGVAGGIGIAPVSIVDRADTPAFPYKPNFLMNLLAGLGVGLLAGIAAAVALEFVNDTIKTREDVRTKLRLPCLGAVPKTVRRTPSSRI